MSRDSRQHPGPDFFPIVKRKHEVWPAVSYEDSVRSRLSLDLPADPQQRCQDLSGLGARPAVHAAENEIVISSELDSPFSRRSATTRRARAWTFAWASPLVVPYTITPGRSSISAIHRPSVSCSMSTLNVIISDQSYHRPNSVDDLLRQPCLAVFLRCAVALKDQRDIIPARRNPNRPYERHRLPARHR